MLTEVKIYNESFAALSLMSKTLEKTIPPVPKGIMKCL